MTMKTFKNNKTRMMIALIAIVAVTSTILGTSGITAEVLTDDSPKDTIHAFDPSNEGFLAKSEARSVIIVGYTEQENAVTTRGDSLITTITITHMANNAASDRSVTIAPIGTIGVIIPEQDNGNDVLHLDK